MSSIEKLLIRGIRSFAPDDTNVIEFYTPLTLICGHNGAGKTTIIECLKYVTTGDLPPNSRNGAFIYDPKIANLNEVKAQVKLRFKNTSGKPLIVTRSMSLTQKKGGGYTQKSLENVLMVKNTDTGVDASLSSKCAEVDLLVPEHMGVSPAIIDNVIFCHQEESFWPLSEPSTLKKKFDDIFAATRYTKALDTIKSLKKDRTTTLKLNRQELEHVKSDEEKAHKVRTLRFVYLIS
ncbi:AAA domain-containing protein [Cladochytrium replicatum]|nr:AAA domain-containing protein [Cladochytrium replicatum]